MASIEAARGMLSEIQQILQKGAFADHACTKRLVDFLENDGTTDENIMHAMQKHLIPNASMIQSRNVASLAEEYPDLQLHTLSATINKEDAQEFIKKYQA